MKETILKKTGEKGSACGQAGTRIYAGAPAPDPVNIHMCAVYPIHMASMYYVCADCGDAVQEIMSGTGYSDPEINMKIGEYCDCCNNWNPEVVIAYR
jgi:DNA-directed RNA polymerase subunit RPC12/RpoP